ncbi:MAG: hypothetical protein HYZ37_10670 [Candidatus Solibacter usitatus]|nr:hypothetical protein [Candidatus Solibacter usitatus]
MRFSRYAAGCLAAVPVMLMGFSTGPPVARTGAAIDGNQNCTACHRTGTANDGVGRVGITSAAYTPGVKQKITIELTHPTAMRWGFEVTARLASDPSQKAGTFNPTSDLRHVCGITGNGTAAPCAATAVEFVTHTQPATFAGTSGGHTWEFEWTPPSTNVGDVVFFAAGNASNNNGANSGDSIYTTSLTISPAGSGPRPSIVTGGVLEAFTAISGVTSHGFAAIYGSNLAGTVETWDNAISGGALPTVLGGVSVKINNKPAAIHFVSANQVNVLSPVDDATGDVSVVLTNANGDSNAMTVKRLAAVPAFYAPFGQNNRLFVTAVALDGTLLGKVGVDSRVRRPARPGETIQLFGSGFGATNPVVPADRIVSGSPALVRKPTIQIGGTTVDFGGNGNLIAAGLYQFNVTIPASLADGDHAITAMADGTASANTVFISVAR